jgi:glycosyltransferase involved in cell wall biosynthesis
MVSHAFYPVEAPPRSNIDLTHENPAQARRVSIVIPVYNSEGSIERLCRELIAALVLGWNMEIILVDDGSKDGSASICRRLHEEFPGVISCVMLSRNFGEHNAVMAGLNFATGDYCVIMDDDFQNPPAQVEALLREAAKGFDVVYTRYAAKKHSGWRNLGSSFHNRMATWALGKPKDLYLSSFKLLSRFVVQEVIQYTGPDPYLDAIILRITSNVGTITVNHEARKDGVSGYTFRKLVALWSNMMVAFSVYPLRVIGLFGFMMLLIGATYGGYTLLASTIPGFTDPSDLDQLQASLWFFRGSTLVVISIVGEYVGRIHRHLNAAPQFIIRHRLLCNEPLRYRTMKPFPPHEFDTAETRNG